MKPVIKIVKYFLIFAGAVTGMLALLLLYATLSDYKPRAVTAVSVHDNRSGILKQGTPISALTFNIGYCGLDKSQDFFMDGGTHSRSGSKEQTITNLEKISDFIATEKASLIMLQEVDVNSSRSFNVNELAYMQDKFSEYASTFGKNYSVAWVPVPLSSPMGSVESGLAVFSRFNIASGARYQYPGGEKWPVQLFELDRCFIENRMPVDNGKELVLINSHLSAFDKGGEIRKMQLEFLKSRITGEYEKGNYVIVGGDWNHVLPGTDPFAFKNAEEWPFWLQRLPEDFTPEGFKWGADGSVPSVRTVAAAYKKDVNFTAVIDGFLVSPNVEIQKVTGHRLEFENSDHNPVTMEFYLK